MRITVLSLFPDYFVSPLQSSILARAQAKGLVEVKIVNIRDYAVDKHQITDDRPYGGGPGMVMLVEPIDRALTAILDASPSSADKNTQRKIILTSAKGQAFDQKIAQTYSQLDELVIICGHYEGVDERVADNLIDEEIRIGDYVLTGGEPAASVILDATVRLLAGVLGNDQSTADESHTQPGVLGFPQYSQPREYKGWTVPSELLTGNHSKIAAWRASHKQVIQPEPEPAPEQ